MLNVGQQEPMHFAFSAQTCQEVDVSIMQLWLLEERIMVHLANVKNYHVGYYAAFIIDPDGNNIEAVCHKEE